MKSIDNFQDGVSAETIRVPGLAVMMEEIRHKYPELTDAAVRRILRLPSGQAETEERRTDSKR
jgi:hypothetical protein